MIAMGSFRRRCKYVSHAVERRCYPGKRPHFEPSPARSLQKRDDKSRSRFEEKASEIRYEQEQYAQRRSVFFAWAADHVETLGAVLPIKRCRTRTEIRFENVNSAVSFSISAKSIGVPVSQAGKCWDFLADFDSVPRKVTGGYVDDLILPEYIEVYPDWHVLWEREVFDYFRRWYAEQFAVATELWLYSDSGGYTLAVLYPGKYATDPDECVHLPLFIPPVVAVQGSEAPDRANP